MNKKLLFAAVGAALAAAPMVVVHADTTLYGQLHEASESINNANSKSGFIASNTSRIGVKGDEDLGSGLKAIYQVESGSFGMNDGAGGLGGTLRNTYLGMADSSWGAVKVGRYDTPFKELGAYKLNNFTNQVGDMRNALSGGSFASNSPFFNYVDARVDNMIRYESPTWSGFNGVFLHSSNGTGNGSQGPGGTSNSVNSIGLNWAGGPFFAGLAYQKDGFQKGGVYNLSQFANAGVALPPTITVTKNHDNFYRLAGSYMYEDFTVGLLYQDLKDIGGANLKQDAYGMTASYKIANNLVKFQYLKAKDFKFGTGGTTVNQTGGKLWALGLDHSLSKSTLVYIDYSQASNNQNTRAYSVVSANAGNGVDMLPTKTGQKVKGMSAGMVLNF